MSDNWGVINPNDFIQWSEGRDLVSITGKPPKGAKCNDILITDDIVIGWMDTKTKEKYLFKFFVERKPSWTGLVQ